MYKLIGQIKEKNKGDRRWEKKYEKKAKLKKGEEGGLERKGGGRLYRQASGSKS